jgi:hypothetical protein
MARLKATTFAFALLACSLVRTGYGAPTSCPPRGFDSVSGFVVKKYINGPWYSQQQVLNSCSRLQMRSFKALIAFSTVEMTHRIQEQELIIRYT